MSILSNYNVPCLQPHNKTQQDNKANYWSAKIWVLARLSKKGLQNQRAKKRFLKDDDSPILLQKVVGFSHELKKLLIINCRNHLFSLYCFISIEKACLQVMVGCSEGHSGMQMYLRGFLQTPSDESYNISDRTWQAYNSTFDERIVHDNDFY